MAKRQSQDEFLLILLNNHDDCNGCYSINLVVCCGNWFLTPSSSFSKNVIWIFTSAWLWLHDDVGDVASIILSYISKICLKKPLFVFAHERLFWGLGQSHFHIACCWVKITPRMYSGPHSVYSYILFLFSKAGTLYQPLWDCCTAFLHFCHSQRLKLQNNFPSKLFTPFLLCCRPSFEKAKTHFRLGYCRLWIRTSRTAFEKCLCSLCQCGN